MERVSLRIPDHIRRSTHVANRLRSAPDRWQDADVVEVLIGVRDGNAVAELASLTEWLQIERDLAGQVRQIPGAVGPTDLGGALDTLSVAIGSGGIGVALAQSLTAWLRTRRSDVKLTITIDGRTVEIDAHRIADPTELITRALDHPHDDDDT
jgi:hypothetical protein